MRNREPSDDLTRLVVAARGGDRAAGEQLVREHLPLVYNLVRRALDEPADADDVVQDAMLLALRRLPTLRRPETFRSWLLAIALERIEAHRADAEVRAARTAGLDEVAGTPDAGAEVEGAALLRTELARQRRQVLHAGRWLDADHRALVPLWWLEVAGRLTRAELAAALGVNVAHAGVRVQRMRQQLDQARAIVGALEAMPGCDRLDEVTAEWDGIPSPFWRKRLARHLDDCAVCARAAQGWFPTDRLLTGLAFLPVPAGLTAGVLGKGAVAGVAAVAGGGLAGGGLAGGGLAGGGLAGGGLAGGLMQAVVAHPIGAAVAAAALAAGVAVTTTAVSGGPPPGRPAIAAPTRDTSSPSARPRPSRPAPSSATSPVPPAAGLLRPGRASLEAGDSPGRFVTVSGDLGVLAAAGPRASFEVVPGLADPACFSMRVRDGRYLRHASWRLRLSPDEGTVLFRGDATFCVRAGGTAGSIMLESSNYPGWFLRHVGDELWVDRTDGSAAFRADSSFVVRPA